MRISQKLILNFVGIVLLMGLVGYISINILHRDIETTIGQKSLVLVGGILDKIDRNIYHRIEQAQAYCKDISQEPVFINSNRNFDEMDDVKKYINQKDNEWTAVSEEMTTPFMQELINNELSEEIRDEFELKEFYEQKYGYPVFAEVFVTNKYGANIAQSRKTTDYYQADEEWWQKAKEDGLYVSDVEFDKSSDIYSTNICVRIDDADGNFAGVLKAVLNIKESIGIIKAMAAETKEENIDFKLLSKDGKIIYSSKEFKTFEKLDEKLLSEIRRMEIKGSHFFVAQGGKADEREKFFGLPPFYVPVVMRVYHTYSPCLEKGGA